MSLSRDSSPTRPPLWISVASFVSSFDRFVVSPILVLVAATFGVSVGQAVAIASGYYLAYGLCQPLWGALSDRFGRIRLMRWALVGAGVAGMISAAAPNLVTLVAVRVVAGAFFGAIVPTSLTYVGDTVSDAHRQRALSDLMAAMAVGTALAAAAAGITGQLVGWRVVFAVPAVVALVSAWGLRSLAEPPRTTSNGVGAAFRAALSNRWVVVVGILVFVEGGLVLGVLTLLAPALQAQGVDAARAGLAAAAYGIAVLLSSQVLKALTRRLPRWALMAIGGIALTAGYAVAAMSVSVPTIIGIVVMLGITWAFLHTSLQTWATSIVPEARGTVVACFAASLFIGSSIAAVIAGPAADHDQWHTLFIACAVTAAVLTVASVLAYRAFTAREPAPRSEEVATDV
ncbi:MFS transporter [Nocardioides albus]|uniref:Putative MFS family arabinose efflux permease n=1 Tax=Nocardioides albus TaxID=1841 RepID=A0A7W5F6H6_9ACTN|nr:MFS transporter [Nocardioides albus]MBB3087145.1 putative MFS family arabinose efflux permease [Nocardioides albus]GGU06948.1 MFS transporter [Nocardioides albus]